MLKGYKQLQSRFRALQDTPRLMKPIQIEGVRNAKLNVHRRTSNLARTIRPGEVTRNSVSIVAGGTRDVGYAAAEELGRRAVVIRPRKRKVLAWGGSRTQGGRLRKGASPTVFSRIARQPARSGHPFLGPGLLEATKGHLGETVTKVWNLNG